MNQLASIGSFANFHYDAGGNNREGIWLYTNETNYSYDQVNRGDVAVVGLGSTMLR